MPGARERPQTTGASPALSLRVRGVWGEALWPGCVWRTQEPVRAPGSPCLIPGLLPDCFPGT